MGGRAAGALHDGGGTQWPLTRAGATERTVRGSAERWTPRQSPPSRFAGLDPDGATDRPDHRGHRPGPGPQAADRIGVVTVQSASSFPLSAGPTRAALATDLVTCPECGQMATVDMARRQAEDFCRNCDYPLFWASSTVIAPSGEETGASLRRLPGTVGRAATASLLCPHCGEPNSPAAEICIRCALSLHPVEIPEPEPVDRPPGAGTGTRAADRNRRSNGGGWR